jgi:hypothetical protein
VGNGVGVVGVGVGDADEESVRERGDGSGVWVLHKDDGSVIANVELGAVIVDADAKREAEG